MSADRSLAGEARLRSQRLRRHPVFHRAPRSPSMSAADRSRLPIPVPVPPAKEAARISGMFDAIAGRYDLLNHLLSAGLDRQWRRRAIAALQLTGRERCSTSAPAPPISRWPRTSEPRRARRVVGVDFAGAMLQIGTGQGARPRRRSRSIRGDATRLPVADAHRWTPSRSPSASATWSSRRWRAARCAGAAPGRHAGDSRVRTAALAGAAQFYLWYFRHVLPRIGRLVSRHPSAYTYLPASVGAFPSPEEFAQQLARRRIWHRACSPADLRRRLSVRRREGRRAVTGCYNRVTH